MSKRIATLTIPWLLLAGCNNGETIEIQAVLDQAPTEVHEDEAADTPEPAETAQEFDLLDPSSLNARAPESFQVKFETTKGDILIDVHREWAPGGADRFFNLVRAGFFDDTAFFRAIPGFMVQFGLNGDPKISSAWISARIQDDPSEQSNTRGRLTFAMSGPNSRTTQMFINLGNNARLDSKGFPALGEVTSGMEVVDALYTGYGEGAPSGRGPAQDRIQKQGNTYLRADFPQLDYIVKATIVE